MTLDLVGAARGLQGRLAAEAPETERRTHFSPELHQAFLDARFYDMFIPARYGGLETPVATFVEVASELARGDLAAAWCWTLSASHALQVATMFPEEVQDEVFGGGDFRAPATAAPSIVATRVSSGWRLEGTVAYCSGSPYSTYYLGQARLVGSEGEPLGGGTFVAPRSVFTVLDDWGATLGLRGTGSNSIRFDGGVIPAAYLLPGVEINDYPAENGTPGFALHGNPLYAGRAMTVLTLTLGGLAVGGAFAALDEFGEQMRLRGTPLPPIQPRLTDPDYQRWYGAAMVRIGAARAVVLHTAEEWTRLATENAAGTRPFLFADDFRLAALAREAHLQSWEAVEQELARSIGSSALRDGERFAQLYRDLSQAAGHRSPQVRDGAYRIIAAAALGVLDTPVSVSEKSA
jgi:3-hydroxy-9,10-secoandrosta-1,3,5(10)-triene-9,17-dione monooxygenase